LLSRIFIYPYTISSEELVNYHKLSSGSNILPVTVPTTEQILLHRLLTAKNIYPVTISSTEIVSLHRLSPGNANIRPFTLPTEESILLHKLDRTSAIRPVTIASTEIVNLHRLVVGSAFIRPFTFEEGFMGYHNLKARAWIYPFTIDDNSPIEGPGAYLKYGQYIYTNSSWPGQPGYSPIHPEPLAPQGLYAVAFIKPDTLQTLESTNIHSLQYNADIKPFEISSEESVNYHRLVATAFIRPSTIDTLEAVNYHRLLALNFIYPATIISREKINFSEIDVTLTNLVGYESGSVILLSEDGVTGFTWSSESYPRAEVVINGNILATGFAISSATGTLSLSVPLEATDVLEVRLYSTAVNRHKLFSMAYIRPYTIMSREFAGYHKLKIPQFPGFIHSWYVKVQTIESELNFRSES
jgi:hypothetical protein